MTIASDNVYPKVILVEGAAPSSPAATNFKLYVDSSDHLLKYKNSAGVVTTLGTGLTDPMTTRGDVIVRNASNVTARLAIGSTGKVLQSDGTDISWQTPSGGGAPVSVDDVPASPNGADQEFTAMSGWTTLGSLDVSDVTTMPGWGHIAKTATGSFQVHGIYRAIPSMPFTMTARLGYEYLANYRSGGLMLVEAGPGKLDCFGALYENTGAKIHRATWTSRTARASVPILTQNGWTPYWRAIVASSTDVTYQVSNDGILWTTIVANVNPGFTIASYGLWVSGQDNSVAVELSSMYIRFT